MACACTLQSRPQVGEVAGNTAKGGAERIVEAVGRDDSVVRCGIERQGSDLIPGARMVVDDVCKRRKFVVDLIVEHGEEIATLLRSDQQVEGLIVIKISSPEATVIAGVVTCARACHATALKLVRQRSRNESAIPIVARQINA